MFAQSTGLEAQFPLESKMHYALTLCCTAGSLETAGQQGSSDSQLGIVVPKMPPNHVN